jgi:prophage tail gpP-like protein
MSDTADIRPIVLRIKGQDFAEWTEAEVTRDLKDFSGSFRFRLYDAFRANQTFSYSSTGTALQIRPEMPVEVLVDGEKVLVGHIDTVEVDIDDKRAEVTIAGRDKTGDLIDCAAVTTGPAEFSNVKLEDAVKKIVQPYGLSVRSEIDTGDAFARYGIDLSETAFSAIEKGSRERNALVLSDGVGGVVITRTGKTRAPAGLSLPGNAMSSRGRYGHQRRHSHHYVRGQGEKAGKKRTGKPLDSTASPLGVEDRKAGDGSATQTERKGTTATGVAVDNEVTRYRPIVHHSRTKADQGSAQNEADWRMRSRRAANEEVSYKVKDFRAAGQLWRVNQIAYVSDSYQDVERDMLITRVSFRSNDQDGNVTELAIMSPEAFDNKAVGNRRRNGKGKKKKRTGPLDGTAKGL